MFVAACLALIVVGYVAASLVHWPAFLCGGCRGLVLIAGAALFKHLSWTRLSREISPLQYFKLGVIVTPFMPLVGPLAIWVSLLI
ncbi:MAG: hypothetical protein JWP00_3354 [Chloroflexi bacterium]|nr:hypothetical protein [Chloroflexota bacterium]